MGLSGRFSRRPKAPGFGASCQLQLVQVLGLACHQLRQLQSRGGLGLTVATKRKPFGGKIEKRKKKRRKCFLGESRKIKGNVSLTGGGESQGKTKANVSLTFAWGSFQGEI